MTCAANSRPSCGSRLDVAHRGVALELARCASSHAARDRAARRAAAAPRASSRTSPTSATSTRTFLLISAGSSSPWIFLRVGAYVSSLPVTRSSKRMPSAIEQVGLLDRLVDPRLAVHAHHAEAERMGRREPAEAEQRRRHRDAASSPTSSTQQAAGARPSRCRGRRGSAAARPRRSARRRARGSLAPRARDRGR